MLVKGDIVLITDPRHVWAGFTATVKKASQRKRIIIKISKNKKTVWINQNKLIKITKEQQKDLEVLLKERT